MERKRMLEMLASASSQDPDDEEWLRAQFLSLEELLMTDPPNEPGEDLIKTLHRPELMPWLPCHAISIQKWLRRRNNKEDNNE